MEYKLLTPGPLTTSRTVKEAMLVDHCTWDDDYRTIIQDIRSKLLKVVNADEEKYTSVLMAGSGTFGVEGTITSSLSDTDKVLILKNGVYGNRIDEILIKAKKNFTDIEFDELSIFDLDILEEKLKTDKSITHVSFVHLETTTGVLNPLEDLCKLIKKYNKTIIVDAMSSFGGIPIDLSKYEIDFIISSSNKCIQGVPGFCFVICKRSAIEKCKGNCPSLSLDLYEQWKVMEDDEGKWRYTSPTHVVLAFHQALKEFFEEGGVIKRNERYKNNNKILIDGMKEMGYDITIDRKYQSPIVTAFLYPYDGFDFDKFYNHLKENGYIIYPGKLSKLSVFRIANIGEVYEEDIRNLLKVIGEF